MKGRQTMNSSSTVRRIKEDEGQLVLPLSGPNYPSFAKAKRRWRKPLDAILSQVVANSENLLVRLRLGVYAPAEGDLPEAKARFTDLWRATEQQLAAIEAFQEVGWRE
jgi:hypothetical protein